MHYVYTLINYTAYLKYIPSSSICTGEQCHVAVFSDFLVKCLGNLSCGLHTFLLEPREGSYKGKALNSTKCMMPKASVEGQILKHRKIIIITIDNVFTADCSRTCFPRYRRPRLSGRRRPRASPNSDSLRSINANIIAWATSSLQEPRNIKPNESEENAITSSEALESFNIGVSFSRS